MVTRVLIIGDSVTQGAVGDHTWRYRLWKLLEASDADVDFVGPRTGEYDDRGTADPADDDFDEDRQYPDPDFDQDHAATWGGGMSHREDDLDIPTLLADHAPDVVINAEGFNDLTFWEIAPRALLELMARFVDDVRAVRPRASIVIGQLPQRWAPGVEEYNRLLPGLAASLDTPRSRVVVAPAPDFVEGVDTYDHAHPSPAGEVKIADQYAAALAALGVLGDPPDADGVSRR